MIAMILVHPHIFWLSLGGLLLAAEMLGGNGYLLWSGVAAVIYRLNRLALTARLGMAGRAVCGLNVAGGLALVALAGASRAGTEADRQPP
ncbi:Putative activity regulator of membraneprotease YbbK [Salmonella enterica subsp. enterica serovar Daytona]|uniref:Activity regulator of membraneprotease YbbK n=1 Tax=Salmonella enterica subsp. enterica serovar Daytona TaxID=1962639 RepID=A0A447JM29_SALET|nr:Putative activity regulator of membraneprotease YbbK [Salmonella enterica subsp. enterica serovar Daytona]